MRELTHLRAIKFSREWCFPNSATFSIKPIRQLIDRYIPCPILRQGLIIIEPFAGDSSYGTHRNDLNPEKNVEYHQDALEFVKQFPNDFADFVLYDPPYSLRQASECYKSYGKDKFNSKGDYWAAIKDEIARISKKNSTAICFGWNSNGIGKKRGFQLIELMVVAHGGSKNDTICTVEVKT